MSDIEEKHLLIRMGNIQDKYTSAVMAHIQCDALTKKVLTQFVNLQFSLAIAEALAVLTKPKPDDHITPRNTDRL